MKVVSLAALILMLATIFPAKANWQWAVWGATVDQVIANSGGTARSTNEAERKAHSFGTKARPEMEIALVYAPYSAGKYEFDAWFLFDSDRKKLICVNLNLKDKSLGISLRDDLISKYGRPTTSADLLSKTYAWFTEDSIEWREFLGESYSVKYCSRNANSGI